MDSSPSKFRDNGPDNRIAITDAVSYLLKRAFRALGPPRVARYDDDPRDDRAS